MFANLFSRIGLSSSTNQPTTSSPSAAANVSEDNDDLSGSESSAPEPFATSTSLPQAKKLLSQNFSETEFMDSGLASSEVPLNNLAISELNALEFDEGFLEEYILAKLQDVQRRLHIVRARKTEIEDRLSDKKVVPEEELPKRRVSERIFVASHRLPLKINVDASGNVGASVPSGGLGLMSAFHDLKETIPICWVGAPGQATVDAKAVFDDKMRANLKRHFQKPIASKKSMSLVRYVPVFPDEEERKWHQSFCSSIIWPLFHYMPLSFEGERSFSLDAFEKYRRVNELYADVLVREWEGSGIDQEDAMFWIHDFHFMLVPRMLRNRLPNARIGFFLHTPFPSGEVFRTFPVRKEMLEGVLGSDLIGFHTYDYARHFLSSCERILGRSVQPNGVDDKGLFVRVGIYPFGIDTDVFKSTMKRTSVLNRVKEIRSELGDKKIILGIDRLDYIKGIPHKMLAMEQFLENHPEWIGNVVLLQITAPSSSKSVEYQSFRTEILEMAGRINGRFSTLDDMPIHYRETFLKFDELCALYAVSDVAIMTSLRNGMNLSSYEFIMCQVEKKGVLLLSEFTGAAQNLSGAILCNPWDTAEVSEGIHRALTMSDYERELKYHKLERFVSKHTAASWGVNYIQDLVQHGAERKKAREMLVHLPTDEVSESYREASGKGLRLFLLDYDGTIRNYESQPELAEPSEKLLKLLEGLTADPNNLVFIMTGRTKTTMMDWLSGFNLGFAVEHGFSIQWPSHVRREMMSEKEGWEDDNWDDLMSSNDRILMKETLASVGQTLGQFAIYTPSTFVETKESAYSWHFRDADPDFAGSRALDARSALESIVAGTPLEVLMGHKILYVRPRGTHKGAAVEEILKRLYNADNLPQWILSIGDDRTDEDMFKALRSFQDEHPAKAQITTCTVGRKRTAAQYYVEDVDQVIELLEMLQE